MKKVTTRKEEKYDATKHRFLLLINRRSKKTLAFDSDTNRIMPLPSSPTIPPKVQEGRINQERFLNVYEQDHWEIYHITQTELEKVAGHAMVCASESQHYQELLENFGLNDKLAIEQH